MKEQIQEMFEIVGMNKDIKSCERVVTIKYDDEWYVFFSPHKTFDEDLDDIEYALHQRTIDND